jgi:uncharacterized SAM-binding protein YcdF (DUF218 family)
MLSGLLLPMPVCLGLAVIGIALLWFTRRQRAGKILVTVGVGLLAVLGLDPVGTLSVSSLERPFAPLLAGGTTAADLRAQQARWIVVLGGGHRAAPGVPPPSELSQSALARLVEAVRLKRLLPRARLFVSGGAPGDPISEAALYAQSAQVLGVPAGDIVEDGQGFDTAGEALAVRRAIGSEPFILVTSATHLPRALALFRKQGLDPLPSPADFTGLPHLGPAILPGAGAVVNVERAVHEYLGMLFARLRGQI